MLNLIVTRDKIKETYLFANDTEFKILFNSSDWYGLIRKAIFLVGENSYVVEGVEDNHVYSLPDVCVGTEFLVFITGESKNSYKATEKLLIRVMGGNSGSGSEEYALKSIYGDNAVNMGRKKDSEIGENSFAFGYDVTASGRYSHAEGRDTTASGYVSHAEGDRTTARWQAKLPC